MSWIAALQANNNPDEDVSSVFLTIKYILTSLSVFLYLLCIITLGNVPHSVCRNKQWLSLSFGCTSAQQVWHFPNLVPRVCMLSFPWSGKKKSAGNEVALFLFVAGHGFILGIICGFCLLRVVRFSAGRGFSSQCPNFLLSAKTSSSISNLVRVHWMRVCGIPLPETLSSTLSSFLS